MIYAKPFFQNIVLLTCLVCSNNFYSFVLDITTYFDTGIDSLNEVWDFSLYTMLRCYSASSSLCLRCCTLASNTIRFIETSQIIKCLVKSSWSRNEKANTDLEAIILDLLRSKSVFKNRKLKQIENDIGIVYALRNSAAHRIHERPFIHENFRQITDRLFNIIFLAIERLYIVERI